MAIQSLSRDELRRILEQAWAHRKRDWLMILVGVRHGLRASEIVGIKADDIRDGYLHVKRLKGSNATTQRLKDDRDGLFAEREALIEYAKQSYGNQRLFPITRQHFWYLFRRYAEWAGIPEPKRHPHVLKHTLCTVMYQKTKDVNKVRKAAGHKSGASTLEYTKVTEEEADEAMDDLF